MNIAPPNLIEVRDWMSSALTERIEQLNTHVEQLQEQRDELNRRYQDVLDGNASAVDPASLSQGTDLNVAWFEQLQRELKAHEAMLDLYPTLSSEREQAARDAQPEPARLMAAIKKKLVRIGYVDTGDKYDSFVPGSIAPGMLQHHPDVVAARTRAERLKGQEAEFCKRFQREHGQAVDAIHAELERLRGRLMKREV